jgi:hypothetical protein
MAVRHYVMKDRRLTQLDYYCCLIHKGTIFIDFLFDPLRFEVDLIIRCQCLILFCDFVPREIILVTRMDT